MIMIIKCLFVLQNKNWNLVGFLITVRHIYMNKDKSSKIFYCYGIHPLKGRGSTHTCFSTHLLASLIHPEFLLSWCWLFLLQNVGPA